MCCLGWTCMSTSSLNSGINLNCTHEMWAYLLITVGRKMKHDMGADFLSTTNASDYSHWLPDSMQGTSFFNRHTHKFTSWCSCWLEWKWSSFGLPLARFEAIHSTIYGLATLDKGWLSLPSYLKLRFCKLAKVNALSLVSTSLVIPCWLDKELLYISRKKCKIHARMRSWWCYHPQRSSLLVKSI